MVPTKRNEERRTPIPARVGVLTAVAVALVMLVAPFGATTATAATPSIADTYHVAGNEVVAPSGKQFIPYGFVVYCLAETDYSCATGSNAKDPVSDLTKIKDAAMFWHANVIRMQVAEQNLDQNGTVNQTVLSDLKQQVSLANSLGMVAVITDQEEEYDGPPLPTAGAETFWNTITENFKSNARVFFDLYNEPRLKPDTSNPSETEDWMWNLWRNGGTATTDGNTYQFVGMQALVNQIRAGGANNVIVAEGNQGDHDLSGIPQYALDGGNIAYGMEPDLYGNDLTPAEWAANWGNLSDSVPILMEAFQDWPAAGVCNVNSPTLLPQLLSYLQSKHLGLVSWTLSPGVMMVGNNPEDPTSYAGATTQVCERNGGKVARAAASALLSTNRNGPGQLILDFFRANSQPAPDGVAIATPGTPTKVPTSTPTSPSSGTSSSSSGNRVLNTVLAGAAVLVLLGVVWLWIRIRRRSTPGS